MKILSLHSSALFLWLFTLFFIHYTILFSYYLFSIIFISFFKNRFGNHSENFWASWTRRCALLYWMKDGMCFDERAERDSELNNRPSRAHYLGTHHLLPYVLPGRVVGVRFGRLIPSRSTTHALRDGSLLFTCTRAAPCLWLPSSLLADQMIDSVWWHQIFRAWGNIIESYVVTSEIWAKSRVINHRFHRKNATR